MTIRRRLVLSFLAILALFGLNLLIYFWSSQTRSATVEDLRRAIARQILVASIKQNLNDRQKQVALLSQVMAEAEMSGVGPDAIAQFKGQVEATGQQIQELRELSDPAVRIDIESFAKAYQELGASWEIFYENLGIHQTKAIMELATHADPLSQQVMQQLELLQEDEKRRVEAASANFYEVARLTDRMTLLIFALSTIVAIAVAYQIARYLTRGLGELKHDAALIGAGNLDYRIAIQTHDELGDLAQAFNDMAGNLLSARARLTQTMKVVELLQVIASAANEASTVEAAMQISLDQICAYTRWPLGHVHLRDSNSIDRLVPTTIWHLDDPERFETFRQVTEVTRFSSGVGLPGRVFASGKPVWISDVTKDANFPRAKLATDVGVRAAFGFPVLVGAEVVAVLEFFSAEAKNPDESLLAVVANIGAQLGRVFERTKAERELQIAKDAAEAASRHKSDFLASMSHELRTPLNAIIGFSEVLLEKMFGELNDKQEEYLQDVLSSGRHLLSLINDILDLSKVEAGKMELEPGVFNLRELLEGSLVMVKERALAHGIALSLDVADGIDTFVGDERKVKQILFNLLSNAVKFTPDKGKIGITAKKTASAVHVSVWDTGIGIAVEDQQRIFEEFQQVGKGLTEKPEGTGLGLALTKKFVELHGGAMWVDSTPGRGSTFTFTLPSAGAADHTPLPAVPPQTVTAGVAETVSTGPLVLVIEDDAKAAELLRLYLTEAGYTVALARDGTEGLEKVKQLYPDAVILDVLLPKVDGWAFLTQLKAEPATKDVPVIITSVIDQKGKGFALGAAHYLVKPVRKEELLRELSALRVWERSGKSLRAS